MFVKFQYNLLTYLAVKLINRIHVDIFMFSLLYVGWAFIYQDSEKKHVCFKYIQIDGHIVMDKCWPLARTSATSFICRAISLSRTAM